MPAIAPARASSRPPCGASRPSTTPLNVEHTYHQPPIWDGLGVLEYAIVPHVDSPGHPENRALEQVADEYRRTGTPHKTLRDGQVLLLDGVRSFLCG
jgi:dipeptidase E